MKIEVVDFYPAEKKKPKKKGASVCIGTLHIYIVEQDIDLRGILVFEKGKKLFFQIPFAYGKNDEGKNVQFPFFQFLDRKKNMEFRKEMVKQCLGFIKKESNGNTKS